MIVFAPQGLRLIDERDVIAVYPRGGDGAYGFAVLILDNGTSIAGAVAVDVLARLKGELAALVPPAA